MRGMYNQRLLTHGRFALCKNNVAIAKSIFFCGSQVIKVKSAKINVDKTADLQTASPQLDVRTSTPNTTSTTSQPHHAENRSRGRKLSETAAKDELQPRKRKHKPHKPASEETKQRISAAMKGHKVSEETRQKMRKAKLGRKLSLGHRLSISQSHVGKQHSQDTRQKISRMLKVKFAAKRGVETMVSEVAQLGPSHVHDTTPGGKGATKALDPLVVERAVSEMVSLRRDIVEWMAIYERVFGTKPSMEDTARESPQMYSRFMRYIALRDLVRDSNL